jgi:hypothetical protein
VSRMGTPGWSSNRVRVAAVASDRITRERDTADADPLIEQPPVGIRHIIGRHREHPFGEQVVADEQRARRSPSPGARTSCDGYRSNR